MPTYSPLGRGDISGRQRHERRWRVKIRDLCQDQSLAPRDHLTIPILAREDAVEFLDFLRVTTGRRAPPAHKPFPRPLPEAARLGGSLIHRAGTGAARETRDRFFGAEVDRHKPFTKRFAVTDRFHNFPIRPAPGVQKIDRAMTA